MMIDRPPEYGVTCNYCNVIGKEYAMPVPEGQITTSQIFTTPEVIEEPVLPEEPTEVEEQEETREE